MDKKVILTAVLTVGLKELVDYVKVKYVLWKTKKAFEEL